MTWPVSSRWMQSRCVTRPEVRPVIHLVFMMHQHIFAAPFPGTRYMVPGDPAVVLVFDKNGYIAGMQTMVS